MRIKINDLILKLSLSYVFIVLAAFGPAAYFFERKTLGYFLLVLCAALVLGAIMAAGIVGPLNRIIYGARKFSRGDFKHRIFLGSKGALGELAAALNKMASFLEEKIKEVEVRNQHLDAIWQSMGEGIIAVDRAGNILSTNPSADSIFDIKKEKAQNKLFLEAIPNNDIAELIDEVLRAGEPRSRELAPSWRTQKALRVDVSPIFEKSVINGCLMIVHDVTEIRKLETMRRDFVANVSHELKTPLTSIRGFVETLIEGALYDKENARHFLQIISDHTRRLDNLVNDLLSLSYLESAEISVEKEEVDIKRLTDNIFTGFGAQLRERAIETKNELPESFLVNADRDKINQVLTNLIDNAIKFNKEKGHIKVYVEKMNGGRAKFVVEDNGIGIPQKDAARVFERFYRVDKARSREMGGTGLGLSIVKHIIELHGGTVGMESVEGLGSKFWFILPK